MVQACACTKKYSMGSKHLYHSNIKWKTGWIDKSLTIIINPNNLSTHALIYYNKSIYCVADMYICLACRVICKSTLSWAFYIQCANQNMPQNELNEVAHHKRCGYRFFCICKQICCNRIGFCVVWCSYEWRNAHHYHRAWLATMNVSALSCLQNSSKIQFSFAL